jgi:glucose-1-phosphate thymidylyltransferase
MDKAVILARGMGTRMRKADARAGLSEAQAHAADSGAKCMIPVGRPFLDYVLGALADAGYRRVCLVIGPDSDLVRDYYTRLATERLAIELAVQEEPLGTADAVAAAEEFTGNDDFLVINADNYYPVSALRALRELGGEGLAAFTREGLLRGGNVSADRVQAFSVIEGDAAGNLICIHEKPDMTTAARLPGPMLVSMNCWRFGPAIYEACRAIEPSPRGELEIPDAVQYSIDRLGRSYRILSFDEPVLDLSFRSDVASVKEQLMSVEIRL